MLQTFMESVFLLFILYLADVQLIEVIWNFRSMVAKALLTIATGVANILIVAFVFVLWGWPL